MESRYRFADMTAIPTNVAATAVRWPAYSNESGSISWSVRKAMIPPTAMGDAKEHNAMIEKKAHDWP